MLLPPVDAATLPAGNDLEETLTAVESRLAALGVALLERNSADIDTHAGELHRATVGRQRR